MSARPGTAGTAGTAVVVSTFIPCATWSFVFSRTVPEAQRPCPCGPSRLAQARALFPVHATWLDIAAAWLAGLQGGERAAPGRGDPARGRGPAGGGAAGRRAAGRLASGGGGRLHARVCGCGGRPECAPVSAGQALRASAARHACRGLRLWEFPWGPARAGSLCPAAPVCTSRLGGLQFITFTTCSMRLGQSQIIDTRMLAIYFTQLGGYEICWFFQ